MHIHPALLRARLHLLDVYMGENPERGVIKVNPLLNELLDWDRGI